MRKLPISPAAALLLATWFAMPAAHAQQRDDGAATGAPAQVDADAAAGAGAEAVAPDETTRSGFGQVMSVLTGLLQDAARREATGQGDGFALDNPAIEISVTPAEGQTSLLREAPAGKRMTARERHAAGARALAGGTPR